jgi:hypothetical protein
MRSQLKGVKAMSTQSSSADYGKFDELAVETG